MIAIRPANNQAADASAFADLADMASQGLFSYVLGRRVRHVLEGTFKQAANDNSYQNTYFVTVHSQIAGMVSGYSQAQTTINGSRTNWLFARYTAWGAPGVLWRGFPLLPMLGFINNLPEGHYYVQFVAIYPNFRGQGLSKILLEQADEVARQRSCTTLALDVEIHNTLALNAYIKHGMAQAGASPVVKFRGQEAGLYRMEKPLN
jgi:ribosomal protein S18 acetylase RimI-like enzyme